MSPISSSLGASPSLDIRRTGPVVRVHWRGMPTAEGVARLRLELRQAPCQVLVHEVDMRDLALARLHAPSAATREQLTLLGRETEGTLRGAAALVRGNPIASGMARAAILAVRTAARSQSPFLISSDPVAITRFVDEHTEATEIELAHATY